MYGPQDSQRRSDSTRQTPRRPRPNGGIMWLPAKTVDLGFDAGLYNHPVVVLSVYADATIDFFSITSFGGRSLLERFPIDKVARSHYLPIYPNDAHPENNILLELSGAGNELQKMSYINTAQVHTTKLGVLRPYRTRSRQNMYLSKTSYDQLVKFSQYSDRSLNSGSMPVKRMRRQAAVTFFAYSQGQAQDRPDERTSLLPPDSMLRRRRYGHVSSSRLNWCKVFAVIIGSVIILASFYGIYWAGLKISQLALSCWHWLEHFVIGEWEAIKAWFAKLLVNVSKAKPQLIVKGKDF